MMSSLIVSSTLGPLLVAVVLNSVVYGACCLQFFEYATTPSRDSWMIKCLVAWIAVVDTFSVCSSTSLLWHYAIDNFGNLAVLVTAPWQYNVLPISMSIYLSDPSASVPIQLFLAWRVKSLSNSWAFFALISVLSFAQGAISLVTTIKMFSKSSLAEHPLVVAFVAALVSLTTACDIIITGCLIYYLQMKRTGFKKTDFTIKRYWTWPLLPVGCTLGVTAEALNIHRRRVHHHEQRQSGLWIGTRPTLYTLNARPVIVRDTNNLATGTFDIEASTSPSLQCLLKIQARFRRVPRMGQRWIKMMRKVAWLKWLNSESFIVIEKQRAA
ncbi:hypothetical protein C8R47DRAFT_1073286 [Mycena vitilis]|nr:hypothetical protein C8R47DRAFT_1073286 [Mycena vitilis]